MRSKILLAAFVAFAFVLSGCSDGRLIRDDDHDTDKSTLVFGYVDMKDAPCDLGWVSIRQVLPKTDKPFWHMSVDDGMYWNSHMPAGAYEMESFGGFSGWRNADYTFSLPRQATEWRFRANGKPGLHFIGSYKYVEVKTGFFEAGKFEFQRVNSPTERELLERMLKFTESPTWKARIQQRIAELGK